MTDRLYYIFGLIIEAHDTFLTDQSGFERWLSSHDMYFVNADYWADSFIDFYVFTYNDFNEKNWHKCYGRYEIFDPFFGRSVHLSIPASVIDNFKDFDKCIIQMQKEIYKRNKKPFFSKFRKGV